MTRDIQLPLGWDRCPPAGRELFEGSAAIPSDVNEAQLLAWARDGDEQAFAQLFALHQRPIYRYAVHMCGADAADDIVQDTFMAVLKQNGTFDAARGSFGAYLLGIARHLMLKRLGLRYAAPTEAIETVTTRATSDLSALELLSRQEIVSAVRAAIASLPPAYRETIVLCDLQEMDYQSAATVLECPLGTVRSRLHRARTLLAEKLSMLRSVDQAS
jgi:RNA polymerase sigma-70 factor (ECF subfamily)